MFTQLHAALIAVVPCLKEQKGLIPKYVAPTESVVFYQLDDPVATRAIYLSSLKQHTNPVQQKLLDFMWDHSLLRTIPGALGG